MVESTADGLGCWTSLTSVWTLPGLDVCSGPPSPLPGAPPQVTGPTPPPCWAVSMPMGLSPYSEYKEALRDPLEMRVLGGGHEHHC